MMNEIPDCYGEPKNDKQNNEHIRRNDVSIEYMYYLVNVFW